MRILRCVAPRSLVACVLGAGLAVGTDARADTVLPPGFAETLIADQMPIGTSMTFAPDGRLFISQQYGQVRIVKDGKLLETPFVKLPVDHTGERGVLGVTLDPAFEQNQFVYVYYTSMTPTVHNRLSRFTADGDVAVPGSEVVVLDLDDLSESKQHNGGAIHFGPDGKLYVGQGDNTHGANAQTLENLFGKILRLNADGSIPIDNPFYATATGKNRAIWALGFRNPFTYAFQPGTGKMFIDDVGEAAWEEINLGAAGANYGWPTTEGATDDPRFVGPVFTYSHTTGTPTGCAIAGGTFYNPPVATFPAEYVGNYFFADFCGHWIYRLDPTTGTVIGQFADGIYNLDDLAVGPEGDLYYLSPSQDGGGLWKISFSQDTPPTIVAAPQSVTVAVGQAASFMVSATGTAPLSYQWQRDGADIAGATDATFTLPSVTAADDGAQFRAVVTNAFGNVTSDAATLTVITDMPPAVTITAPAPGDTYAAGDTVSFAGTATDAEDGSLPASAFVWSVVFHHEMHTHPFIDSIADQTEGTFLIPTSGETSTHVWYRIHLIVTDSAGISTEVTRDILPRTAVLTLRTVPPGLGLTLDGQPVADGATAESVVGMTRSLGAPSPQTIDGTADTFSSWSDGGDETHDVSTPAAGTDYTATFAGPGAPLVPGEPAGSGGCGVAGGAGASGLITVLMLLLASAVARRRWSSRRR